MTWNLEPPESSDARWKPLLDFIYSTYRDEFGVTLILDQTDMKQFKSMLTKTKNLSEYSADAIQMAWLCFTRSAKQFDREQGHPLRYFCSGINRFMAQIRTNGSGHNNPNLEASREFVRKRLEGKRQ